MRVHGLDCLTPESAARAVADGGRFVFFEYCISLVVVSLRRPTGVYLVPAGRDGWRYSWRYTLLSLVLGWWGIPWGLIYTPLVILTNLSGGRDVTAELCARLRQPSVPDAAE